MMPMYPEFCVCLLGIDHILQGWINEKIIDLDQQNEYGFSLLCFAIEGGRKSTFQILLEHGASVKASEKPLWAALGKALSGDASFLEGLVERGADLGHACSCDHYEETGNDIAAPVGSWTSCSNTDGEGSADTTDRV